MSASDESRARVWAPPALEELAPLPDERIESPEEEERGGGTAAEETNRAEEAAAAVDETEFRSPLQRLVGGRFEEAGFLLRTLVVEEQQAELAAVVMVALGRRLAGELMQQLDEEPQRELVRAIAGLNSIEAGRHRQAVEVFSRRLRAEDYSLHGGSEYARRVLEEVAGRQGAQELFEQLTGDRSGAAGIAELLENVAPGRISPFISHEHPQTIALILSQLESTQAAGILAQLPERMQADVAYRIATMGNITSHVLRQIEENLEASLREILGGRQDVGGMKVVADILNLAGPRVEKAVLDQFDAQDLEMAEGVRNLMFAFEDIARLTDREIQVLLREVDQKDLVIALKRGSDAMKEKVLSNVSERVRAYITEEMEFLGQIQPSEVEEVQLRIVQQVRQLEKQGKLTIGHPAIPMVGPSEEEDHA